MRRVCFVVFGFCAAVFNFFKKDAGLKVQTQSSLNDIILAQNESTDNGGGNTEGTCVKYCPPKSASGV